MKLSDVKEKQDFFHKEIYTQEELSIKILGHPIPIRNTALIILLFISAALAYNVGRLEQIESEKMMIYNCGLYDTQTGLTKTCRLELDASRQVILNCSEKKQNDFKPALQNGSTWQATTMK